MDLKAEGLLNEAADYFAATLPDVDPRAWRQLLTYCPDELLTAALRARVVKLEAVLERCQTVLGNMALENEGAIFNRWPISHEPLRADARNLLPVIEDALKDGAG